MMSNTRVEAAILAGVATRGDTPSDESLAGQTPMATGPRGTTLDEGRARALDAWARATLACVRAEQRIAPEALVVPVEDPHRASGLWPAIRPCVPPDATGEFARGLHSVITVAETAGRAILALDPPRTAGARAPWLALVRLGGASVATARIDDGGESRLVGARAGDVLVIPRQARVSLQGGTAAARWAALLVLTGEAIAL